MPAEPPEPRTCEEPAQFSQGKGKSPLYFMCQFDSCQSTHGSHGSSEDLLPAAVQAGHHVLPPEGTGLTPHHEPLCTTKAPSRWSSGTLPEATRGCATSGMSYFTDEETESESVTQTCSQNSPVTEFTSQAGADTGTYTHLGACAF